MTKTDPVCLTEAGADLARAIASDLRDGSGVARLVAHAIPPGYADLQSALFILERDLELRGVAREREYSPKWAACQYREKFGAWPPWSWNDLPAAAPGLVTRRWCKSRLIAWRKSQQANNPMEYAR